MFGQKIASLLFKLCPGWFQNWSVLVLNALRANKNCLGLEIGLFIQHSKWKHWDGWRVHLAFWFYSEALFPLQAFMNWQNPPSQDPIIVLSLLFHPAQQKWSLQCKYPQYTVEMEVSPFGVCSAGSWPAPHHAGTPDVFHDMGRKSREFSWV